jgi:hypothetical protein
MAFGFGLLLLKSCDACDTSETRLYTDSWTGLELCTECLIAVLPSVTMSPEEEGDNLKKELCDHLGGPLACNLTDEKRDE